MGTDAPASGAHQDPPDRAAQPPGAIAAEHERPRQRASRKQHKPDPRGLIAAEYMILATSLEEEAFPAAEVLAVYHLRWQIELAFKRLKSLPTSTSSAPDRGRHAVLALRAPDRNLARG